MGKNSNLNMENILLKNELFLWRWLHNYRNILEINELYTYNGQILQDVNYTTIKLFFSFFKKKGKKKEFYSDHQENKDRPQVYTYFSLSVGTHFNTFYNILP